MDLRQHARDAVVCLPTNSVEQVHRMFELQQPEVIVVIDLDLRPVGVITRRAVAAAASGELGRGIPVAELMETHVVSTGPRRTLRDAALQMENWAIHHLPVIDEDGQVAGVLHWTDVQAAVEAEDDLVAEVVHRLEVEGALAR